MSERRTSEHFGYFVAVAFRDFLSDLTTCTSTRFFFFFSLWWRRCSISASRLNVAAVLVSVCFITRGMSRLARGIFLVLYNQSNFFLSEGAQYEHCCGVRTASSVRVYSASGSSGWICFCLLFFFFVNEEEFQGLAAAVALCLLFRFLPFFFSFSTCERDQFLC